MVAVLVGADAVISGVLKKGFTGLLLGNWNAPDVTADASGASAPSGTAANGGAYAPGAVNSAGGGSAANAGAAGGGAGAGGGSAIVGRNK